MKRNRFLLTIIAVLLLCVSLTLASCTGSGDTTTEAPESTDDPVTQAPEVTSGEETTAAIPEETTEEITEEVTTEAPVETTEAPIETTEAPVETTEAPVETTEAPVETTEAPAETTESPVETTEPPVETTEAPVETTEPPVETTEPPVETTELPHTHSFGAWTTVKAATCTEDGREERVCSCGEKETKTVTAFGHTEGEWVVDKEATTSEAGSKHLACKTCGAAIKTESIPVIEITKNEYTVTVIDGFGNPAEGINVLFMNGSTEAAKVKTDALGKASAELELSEYEIVLEASDAYYVPSGSYKVSTASPSATISLVKFADSPEYVYPDEKNGVYTVSVGSICVPVEKDQIRYFFFTPTEGAVYHIYTDSDKVEVGYYGGSFFVTPTNTGVYDENGVMILEVLHTSVGNKLVLGLTSTSATVDECTLTIVRASDIEIKDVERPWEQYLPTEVPTEQVQTPSGTLRYVPIEMNYSTMSGLKEIQVVYNEKDGYYHLETADGPVLYVKITQSTKYLDPLKSISDITNIGKYFYDESGNLVKKESYNEAIYVNRILYPDNKNKCYSDVADKKYGVVPLTSELIYILKNAGDGDWYDINSPDYIFDNTLIPAQVLPQNAWLFAVVYFE